VLVCEVKQIEPDGADVADLAGIDDDATAGRWIPNRLRSVLKERVSSQLRAASKTAQQTLLVVYDNSPVKAYTAHIDVMQAMFGRDSVVVTERPDGSRHVSDPFFGGNKGMGPDWTTSISDAARGRCRRSRAPALQRCGDPL
jgi:hypothetical protein